MSISETINQDIKKAMLAKEKTKLSALRAVKSAFLLEKTSKGGKDEIPADVELKILQKLVKQRKDSAEIYKDNGREELYKNEIAEAEIIASYLPKQLSEEEVWKEIKTIVEQENAFSIKAMGKIMGIATKKLAGKTDGKTISSIVKKMLT
ncbi:MAG: GatB/YqeY domain-containing protein [Chlorobi bacterium]|nr:GatB/YqeY domain-containing protein [Chlorobiota bacterium]